MSAQDRELLEMAALAGGIKGEYLWTPDYCGIEMADGRLWNSRDDDGDALRLSVDLDMRIHQQPGWGCDNVIVAADAGWAQEPYGEDKRAATRLAITRCAAEIGRGLSTGEEG